MIAESAVAESPVSASPSYTAVPVIAYYAQFDVFSIDNDGRRRPAANLVLNVRNLTANTALPSVQTDEYGVVGTGGYTTGASVGDVIEFSHPTSSFRREVVLAATLDEAFAVQDTQTRPAMMLANNGARLRSSTALLYAVDLDDTQREPILVGTGRLGETAKIPIQTALPKRFGIYPISQIDGAQGTADARLRSDLVKEVYVPPTGLTLLWSEGEVFRNTPGDLYRNVLPGECFLNDGDVVKIVYWGQFDAESGIRNISWYYDDAVAFYATYDEPGIYWRLEIDIIRNTPTMLTLQSMWTMPILIEMQPNIVTVPQADDVWPVRLTVGMPGTAGVTAFASYATRYTTAGRQQIAYLIDDDGAFIVDDDGAYLIDHGS